MNNEITFLLTSGGHNAGIVSGPTHPRRRYQMAIRAPGDRYTDPHTWQAQTETTEGSWWPAWNDWLDRQMSGQREAPTMGAADNGYPIVRDAPGKYVLG
jgi:polyhydroxyalkanoate synthase